MVDIKSVKRTNSVVLFVFLWYNLITQVKVFVL